MAKIIEDNILQGIVNYLVTRPYNEVCLVIPILLKLPEAPKAVPDGIENINAPKE